MSLDKNQQVFFELLRAGLWSDHRSVQEFKGSKVQDSVDWEKVYQLAQEQSVQGLVFRGIEELRAMNIDINVPQVLLLQWIGEVQIIEQRNKEMNVFIAELIEKLREGDVYAILVKGQGIAQCYEKPLWRSSGDVDLLLSDSNYDKAKKALMPLATDVEAEYAHFKHQGMTIDGFVVELHGTQHSRLSKRVDDGIDATQWDLFKGGKVRSWLNGDTQVFLPAPDEDVIFVFTHILHHFFIDGIGLRQICDWCRLLWTYHENIDIGLLESRIRKMGLMTEWKTFVAFAVKYLGMPIEAMPLFNANNDLNANKKKADKICKFVLEVGNFGHNQKRKRSDIYALKKTYSLWRKFKNFYSHFKVFPIDSVKFFFGFFISGLDAASRGE